MDKKQDSFMFTVGKLDAGMAILLGERAHLIEFPSILLPPGATTGSVVNISVHQNLAEEKRRHHEFWALQNDILAEFGQASPDHPRLELRNITQTSVTLEWPLVQLATARLRSLDIYRNGQRLAAIPSPLTNTSTKLSGLEINTEYSFQLILRTTAGTFPSNLIRARTHTMTDTSGISVCFGNIQDDVLLDNAKLALREMKAKWSDKIQIDTTHFVCTTPAATPNGAQASGNASDSPGVEYQRALQLSIPVVQPHWILACHAEKKMMPIASFYLGTTPSAPNSATLNRPQSMSQASTPRSAVTPNTASNRASMPSPLRSATSSPPPVSAFVNSQSPTSPEPKERLDRHFDTVPEERVSDIEEVSLERTGSKGSRGKSRAGTMNLEFKFPPSSSPETPPKNTAASPPPPVHAETSGRSTPASTTIAPSSVEVPPPPPMEKERSGHMIDDGESEELGETEEIALN